MGHLIDTNSTQREIKPLAELPNCYIIGNQLGQTPGIHLIAGAFQEAAIAVDHLQRTLDSAAKSPMVSTHNTNFNTYNASYWQKNN